MSIVGGLRSVETKRYEHILAHRELEELLIQQRPVRGDLEVKPAGPMPFHLASAGD